MNLNQWILTLGFKCEIYSKEPLVRLYVNNILHDEFNIPEFSFDKENPLLKCYVFKYKELPNNLNIQLKVSNNDNNYNNGFMTKLTNIKLSNFYFFPHNAHGFFKRVKELKDKRIKFSKTDKKDIKSNVLFNLLNNTSWTQTEGNHKGTTQSGAFHTAGSGYYETNLYKKYGLLINKTENPFHFTFDYPKSTLDRLQEFETI